MEEKKLSKRGRTLEFLFALIFTLIGIALRSFPHLPNFTPIIAIALFGGVYFPKRKALIIPIMTMFISDMFIGFYDIKLMASVYISFLLCVILGFWVKRRKKWYIILGSSIVSSLLFFLITNLSVWIFTSWYDKNLSGLLECFIMALPFFKNSVLGDMFYVIIFFGVYEIIELWIKRKFTVLNKSPIPTN